MPAAEGGVPAAITGGIGIAQAIGAGKEAKRAKEAIDNYQRQTLTNPYSGMQVSTLGADRMREDLARTVATMTEQAALGGIKGVASLAPNIVQQQNAQEAQIAANLDEQEKQRQQMIAQGNAMVQQMTEQRENNDLLGLGQQLSVAQQNQANGFNTLAQAGAGAMAAGAAGIFADKPGIFDNMFNGYFNSQGYKDSQIQTVLPGAQVTRTPYSFNKPLTIPKLG